MNEIAIKLQTMLESDDTVDSQVHVTAQDLYRTTQLETGYGQGGDVYNWPYFCHSIMQYLVWPDGLEQRLQNLRGRAEHDWDHIIVAGDLGIVLTTLDFMLSVSMNWRRSQTRAMLNYTSCGWTNHPDDQTIAMRPNSFRPMHVSKSVSYPLQRPGGPSRIRSGIAVLSIPAKMGQACSGNNYQSLSDRQISDGATGSTSTYTQRRTMRFRSDGRTLSV